VEEAGNETETEDTKNSTRARVKDRRDRRVEKSVSPKGKLGRPTASIELVLEGILYVLSEGCSWRAIDRKELSWNTVYKYFRKWCRRNAFERLLNEFGPELEPGWHFVDSTHVKVHARWKQSSWRTSSSSRWTDQRWAQYQNSCSGQFSIQRNRDCTIRRQRS
jgi:transposase